MGYKSLVGAANKIVRFEETGDIDHRLFRKLADVLSIDKPTIRQLMERDRRELVRRWSHWANERITPYMIACLMPGLFMGHRLPEDATTLEKMEQHASSLARELHQRIWLVVSRRLSVVFDEGGNKRAVQEAAPGEPTEPFVLLRKSGRRFMFTSEGDDVDLRTMRWPEKHGPRTR